MRSAGTGAKAESEMRRQMMAVLAHAPSSRLAKLWSDAGFAVVAEPVRGPETGLVTVRGRIGGGGAAFNVGEATVTRATVRLAGGEVGHSYALGRDADKARIAATIDALWQKPELRARLEDLILGPLRLEHAGQAGRRAAEVAATKVDFFTMVRGED